MYQIVFILGWFLGIRETGNFQRIMVIDVKIVRDINKEEFAHVSSMYLFSEFKFEMMRPQQCDKHGFDHKI